MKVAIYTRVSTTNQSVDMQLSDLRSFAGQRGFEICREYCDIGISGSKDSRPQLNALMDDVRKKKVDAVLVWKFDRFARSMRHLINALHEFQHLGVDFISFSENIDTSSPTGKVMFAIIGAMAEFERELIRERVKSSLNTLRSKGQKLGRPSRISHYHIEQIQDLRQSGKSLRAIGKRLGISASLVHKTLSNFNGSNPEKSSIPEAH